MKKLIAVLVLFLVIPAAASTANALASITENGGTAAAEKKRSKDDRHERKLRVAITAFERAEDVDLDDDYVRESLGRAYKEARWNNRPYSRRAELERIYASQLAQRDREREFELRAKYANCCPCSESKNDR